MTEDQIQRAVFQHLSARKVKEGNPFPFHVPNGGRRDPITGARLKALGVVPGIPDVLIPAGGSLYCLELKAAKGRLSPPQLYAHQQLEKAGALVAVSYGLDEAIQQLWDWGLIV